MNCLFLFKFKLIKPFISSYHISDYSTLAIDSSSNSNPEDLASVDQIQFYLFLLFDVLFDCFLDEECSLLLLLLLKSFQNPVDGSFRADVAFLAAC